MTDVPPCDDVCRALEEHVRRFFHGHEAEAFTWRPGPILRTNPHFRALRIAPTAPDGLWTYVSIGGWAATAETKQGLEFTLTVPSETPRAIELLAMTVYYHGSGELLGPGHTYPIGEPWVPGSRCNYMLTSLPYPFGPDFQQCLVGDRHVDFLWMLPITEQEQAFKVTHGQEALEAHFEAIGLRYWEIERDSAI
jgi:hypothetical protein